MELGGLQPAQPLRGGGGREGRDGKVRPPLVFVGEFRMYAARPFMVICTVAYGPHPQQDGRLNNCASCTGLSRRPPQPDPAPPPPPPPSITRLFRESAYLSARGDCRKSLKVRRGSPTPRRQQLLSGAVGRGSFSPLGWVQDSIAYARNQIDRNVQRG